MMNQEVLMKTGRKKKRFSVGQIGIVYAFIIFNVMMNYII